MVVWVGKEFEVKESENMHMSKDLYFLEWVWGYISLDGGLYKRMRRKWASEDTFHSKSPRYLDMLFLWILLMIVIIMIMQFMY